MTTHEIAEHGAILSSSRADAMSVIGVRVRADVMSSGLSAAACSEPSPRSPRLQMTRLSPRRVSGLNSHSALGQRCPRAFQRTRLEGEREYPSERHLGTMMVGGQRPQASRH
jgi:hypothetical protein